MVLFALIAAVGLVSDGDSLTATNSLDGADWPVDTTNFVWVRNKAVSGAALLTYQNCPHVILADYTNFDQPFAPRITGTNAFFTSDGALNDLVFERHSESDTFTAATNLMALAHADGYIVLASTLAPSSLLSNDVRLAYNSDIRAATNSYDLLMDWDAILPADYSSNTNYSIDGTHPTDLSAHILAGAMDRIEASVTLGVPHVRVAGGNVTVSWLGYFQLWQSSTLFGPWTDTGARISPFIEPVSSAGFFELRQ